MALENPFPPDIRVEKEVRALLAAGHEVTIVCERRDDEPDTGDWQGARLVRVAGAASGLPARVSTAVRNTFFRDPRFERVLRREARRADAIHVHDLPLAGTAIAVARRSGIPAVLDLHENLPAALEYHRKESSVLHRLVAGLLAPIARWERYESRAVRSAAKTIVVVDEMAERLADSIRIPESEIVVVENTDDAETFPPPTDAEIHELEGHASRFTILYLGGLNGRYRGLETTVEAMPAILAEEPEALLLIVGDGPVRPRLEALVAELGIDRSVWLLGHQPFARVPPFIEAADVCLVPHASSVQTEAALPHKLFQYMLMGKPVVVSTCRPLKRVVEAAGAGVVFTADDPASLAEAVLQLRDPELRRAMGDAGRRAASTDYAWQRSAERLEQLYEELGTDAIAPPAR